MFIYSIRASTIRFFSVIILTLAVLFGIVLFGDSGSLSVSASSEGINFSGMKSNDDRIAFISRFGYEVEEAPVETEEFSVPENFDRIISGYNELQKRQGLDITKYKNKKVTRYTYAVKNYENYDGEVYVNLIVWRNTVIACDVSSADPEGFLKPLVSFE